MNKYIHSLLLIVVLSLLGVLASYIDNVLWIIIVFPMILGIIGGAIYNYVLLKNEYIEKNKCFIYATIVVSIIFFFVAQNISNYYQVIPKFNNSIKTEINSKISQSKTILLDTYNEQVNIYKQFSQLALLSLTERQKNGNKNLINNLNTSIAKNDTIKILQYYNKLISKVGNEKDKELIDFATNKLIELKNKLDNNDYSGAFDEFVIYIKRMEQESGKQYLSDSDINDIKKGLNNKNANYNLDDILKESVGFGGYFGFWLNSIKYGGQLLTNGNKNDFGVIGGILFFIIDILSLFIGIIKMLTLFSLKICPKHNKTYKQFGNNYFFATRCINFNKVLIQDILRLKIFKIPEKKSLFTFKKIYYGNVSFLKCPDCELGVNEIRVQIMHTGLSKKKQLTGNLNYFFDVSHDDYIKIVQLLENLSEEDIKTN